MGIIVTLFIVILIALGLGVYFLPSIIAYMKKKANFLSIFLLNLLLGWSLIAWVIALIWATSQDNLPQQIVINNQNDSTGNSSNQQEG